MAAKHNGCFCYDANEWVGMEDIYIKCKIPIYQVNLKGGKLWQ